MGAANDNEFHTLPVDDFVNYYMGTTEVADEKHIDHAIQVLKNNGILVSQERTVTPTPRRKYTFDPDPTGDTYDLGEDDGLLGWAAFETCPSRMKRHEDAVFAPISEICSTLSTALPPSKPGLTPQFTLELTPNSTTASEVSGSTHKTDAIFRPRDRSKHIMGEDYSDLEGRQIEHLRTSEIGATLEFKCHLRPKEVLDDRLKALSCVGHGLHNDSCRTHAYAITIEDTAASVWYFSRSHCAKSMSFNFMKCIRKFVRVLLWFIFATEEDMGYDPTVCRVLDSTGRIHYVHSIRDTESGSTRHFLTRRFLSRVNNLCLTGRATRVSEVVEVNSPTDLTLVSGTQAMVLKDAWLNKRNRTERMIQNDIFARLRNLRRRAHDSSDEFSDLFFPHDTAKARLLDIIKSENWSRYFLTIVTETEGACSKSVAPAAKPVRGLFVVQKAGTKDPSLKAGTGPMQSEHRATAATPGIQEACAAPRLYEVKKRYRVVFLELCEPLDQLTTLRDVCAAMLDCLDAYQLMFLARYVHRDISSGNLLYLRLPDGVSGRGILSDLEYAKDYEEEGSGQDPKTGTSSFMALEVHAGKPFLADDRVPSRTGNTSLVILKADDSDDEELSEWLEHDSIVSAVRAKVSPPGVKHTWSHDLESFFWLLLLFLALLITLDPDNLHSEEIEDWRTKWATPIFQDSDKPSDDRMMAFKESNELRSGLAACLPKEHRKLAKPVGNVRLNLHNSHRNRQPKERSAQSHHAGYFFILRECLQACLKHAQEERFAGIPLGPHSDALPLLAAPVVRSQPEDLGEKTCNEKTGAKRSRAGNVSGHSSGWSSAAYSEPEDREDDLPKSKTRRTLKASRKDSTSKQRGAKSVA